VISYILLTALAVAAVAFIAATFRNDRAHSTLVQYKEHWDVCLIKHGLWVREIAGYDQAPCEVRWRLCSETVRVVRHSSAMLKLVKAVIAGKVTIKQLEAMSEWPSSRLP